MTRVIVETWNGRREMEMSEALAPDVAQDSGVAENALYTARDLSQVIGRLLAEMVERHIFSLDEAAHIAGQYGSVKVENA